MKNQYYSEFPPGLGQLIDEILPQKLAYTPIHTGNTYIHFATDAPPEVIAELPFFQVTYTIISFFQSTFSIHDQIMWCSKNNSTLARAIRSFDNGRNLSFRIVGSSNTIDNKKLDGLIATIEKSLSGNIKVDRGHPDFEIRLVEKKSYGFIGIRITKPAEHIDSFQQNSIRKEIAYCMNYLSEPHFDDVFLDPMCGGGIIPIQRSHMAPFKSIIASDRDLSKFREKVKKLHLDANTFEMHECDVHDLVTFMNKKVTKIVTDPPWGNIQNIADTAAFYEQLMNTLCRISAPTAILVLLTPHREIITHIIKKSPEKFELQRHYSCTVSGYEAWLMKILIHA